MDTTKLAKQNLMQALTWLVYVHLVAVYFLDHSMFYLLLRLTAQLLLLVPELSRTLRTSMAIIVLINILCILPRLGTPDETGIVVDFIGRAPHPTRLLLVYDVAIILLQLLATVACYQSTDDSDESLQYSGPRYLESGRVVEARSPLTRSTWTRWWAGRDRANEVSGNNGGSASARDTARAHWSDRYHTRAATNGNPDSSVPDDRVGLLTESTDTSAPDGDAQRARSASTSTASAVASRGSLALTGDATLQQAVQRAWPATETGDSDIRDQPREDRWEGRRTSQLHSDRPLPQHQQSGEDGTADDADEPPALFDGYEGDLGGILVIHIYDTLRRYWTLRPDNAPETTDESRPLPV